MRNFKNNRFLTAVFYAPAFLQKGRSFLFRAEKTVIFRSISSLLQVDLIYLKNFRIDADKVTQ